MSEPEELFEAPGPGDTAADESNRLAVASTVNTGETVNETYFEAAPDRPT